MKHWATHLIGKPYKSGASGPEEFDCIGLVRYYFEKRFGVLLPDYRLDSGTSHGLRDFVKATGWHRALDTPQDQDVLLMDGLSGRHVGVVVRSSDGLGLLHAEGNDKRGGVIWQPLGTLVLYRNKEVWRPLCTA